MAGHFVWLYPWLEKPKGPQRVQCLKRNPYGCFFQGTSNILVVLLVSRTSTPPKKYHSISIPFETKPTIILQVRMVVSLLEGSPFLVFF